MKHEEWKRKLDEICTWGVTDVFEDDLLVLKGLGNIIGDIAYAAGGPHNADNNHEIQLENLTVSTLGLLVERAAADLSEKLKAVHDRMAKMGVVDYRHVPGGSLWTPPPQAGQSSSVGSEDGRESVVKAGPVLSSPKKAKGKAIRGATSSNGRTRKATPARP